VVGKAAVLRHEWKGAFGAFCYALRPNHQYVDPLLVSYFLQTRGYRNYVSHLAAGVNINNLRREHVESVEMPIFELPYQRRLARELDAYFTRLDDAEATLERVERNLERYRASVLQAAVEGRLIPTEAALAKAEGRGYETGGALIERTCRGIVSRWLTRPSTSQSLTSTRKDLPGLPEGWCWSTWAQLAQRVTVGYVGPMKDEYRDEGIPFLRSQNVRPNRFDPDGLKRISVEFHRALTKSALSPGDILVVRSGSVGTACVVPDFLTEANCSDMVVVQGPKAVRPRFGAYYMNSMATLRLVQSKKVGIALSHFNTNSVASLPVPVPPLAEQDRIIERVELLLSLIDEVEGIVAHSQARCSQLRQSILRVGFEGHLVDHDPTDEPARVLLERIRAKRAKVAASAETPRRRGRPRKAVRK
jgi:type I restriction enzyme S subunit